MLSPAAKSKEVQGLLLKVAELETLLVILVGLLRNKEVLSVEELENLFAVAEIPEILSARIKLIKEKGVSIIEARKQIISEKLGLGSEPFIAGEDVKETE